MIQGISIPNNIGVPIEPYTNLQLAPVAAISSGAIQTVAGVSQPIVDL